MSGVIGYGLALLCLVLGVSVTSAGERPATNRPVLVNRLPDSGGLMLRSNGRFAFPTASRDRQGFVHSAPELSPGGVALRQNSATGFSDLLLERMHHEIDRIDQRDRDELSRTPPAWASLDDTRLGQLKAMYAERIITKAFDKALDLKLEQFARTSFGLGEAWNWVENFGTRTRSATGFGSAGRHGDINSDSPPPRFSGGIGFKVAAHPRLILHTELFKIRGRIDIPLRNEPVMITVERPLGPRSSLSLTSGLSRGSGDDWTNLSFRLGF